MTSATYPIQAGDYEGGGAASRALKEQLKRIGADPAVVRRAMIAAYEAEMNVVIHAHGGELRAQIANGRLDVEVVDRGPGIPNIEQAMRPGFSTASAKARELGFGAGMGLPNIKKNSDLFAIESSAGEGTQIRFTIFLKSQALYGSGGHSIAVAAEKCHECLCCLHVCPTRAVRVFRGKPQILDYLCIDCTACIGACPTGALAMAGAEESFVPQADAALLVPEPCLAQFGPGVPPQQVVDELRALGFGEIHVTEAWDVALRRAVIAYAGGEAQVTPIISPGCPAVVNLIEARFPSLIPHVAPFLSAPAAAKSKLGSSRGIAVVLCPAQRTALLAGDTAGHPKIITPATFRSAIMPRLAQERHRRDALDRSGQGQAVEYGDHGPAGPTESTRPAEGLGENLLCVTGLPHVMALLEAIENGLAGDLLVVEMWVCDGGCFGSPLLAEDPFLARHRWQAVPTGNDPSAQAVRRTDPFAPRPGLRLDDNMAKAVQKLAKIDKLARSLPGSNCTLCGAPTCGALAEDIVLGRAPADACKRQKNQPEDLR